MARSADIHVFRLQTFGVLRHAQGGEKIPASQDKASEISRERVPMRRVRYAVERLQTDMEIISAENRGNRICLPDLLDRNFQLRRICVSGLRCVGSRTSLCTLFRPDVPLARPPTPVPPRRVCTVA